MKYLLFLLPFIAYGQLSPSAPAVKVGQSITLTAPSAISCTNLGGGSATGCGTTTVVYTAPASVPPNNMAQGCQVTPNDSIWNARVDSFPVKTGSAAMVSRMLIAGSINVSWQYAWALGLVNPGDLTFAAVDYNSGSSYGNYPDSQNSPFRYGTENSGLDGVSGYSTAGGNNADHHTVAIDPLTCHFYEYYNHYLNGTLRTVNGGSGFTASMNGGQDYLSTSYTIGAGNIDAAGYLAAPIEWSGNDIVNGIRHAGRVTLCPGCFDNSNHIWPATGDNGGTPLCSPSVCSVYGDLIHIKTSSLSALEATYCPANSAQSRCNNILAGISQYGLRIADNGATGQIEVQPSASLDLLTLQALNQVGGMPFATTDWEILDTSSAEINSVSDAVCPHGQTCFSGSQSYVTIASSAGVTVSGTYYPIAIQGVAIGLANSMPSYVAMQVGSYSPTFTAVVTGSSNTAYTWSLVSGSGSITSSGTYTPPSSISTPSTTVLKVTANADTNVSTYLTLYLIPKPTNGAVYNDIVSTSNTSDGTNTWLADWGEETPYYFVSGSYFSGTLATQMNTSMFFPGLTRIYVVVPPGNYDVNFYIGEGENPAASSSWPSNPRLLYGLSPLTFETQGVIRSSLVDWGLPYHQYANYATVTIPATVTSSFPFIEAGIYDAAPDITASGNGNFYQCNTGVLYAFGGCPSANTNMAPSSGGKFVSIGAFSVIPDASSAHWSIDTAGQTTIKSGQTLRAFSVIDWFTGVNNPTWSILAGPSGASINSNGVLSLASGTYDNSQIINVQATNGTYTATVQIGITGGTTSLIQAK